MRKRGEQIQAEVVSVLKRSRDPRPVLTDGELQRALVARALAFEPVFLLLDEPTDSVDQDRSDRRFELMYDLGQKIPVLGISHGLAHVAAHWAQSMPRMVAFATMAALVSAGIGMATAIWLNWPAGPTFILAGMSVYALSMALQAAFAPKASLGKEVKA